MELIYNSSIKVDLNLDEIEEILFFILKELKFDDYDAGFRVGEVIEGFFKLKIRIADIFFYLGEKFFEVKIVKDKIEKTFLFKHSKKVTKFFIYYLKDAIKVRKKYTLLIDSLTSLPNRRYFFKELEDSIHEYNALNKKFAIIFFDIKGFKLINEIYGSEVGDLVLQEISNRLKKFVTTNSFVARLGADEFVVILKDLSTREKIKEFVKFLIKELEKPVRSEEDYVDISMIAGISIFPDDGRDKDKLLLAADLALSQAKLEDKKFLFFKKEFKELFLESKRIEKDISKALKRGEFFLVYQPKVDINSSEIIGFEALIRWEHRFLGIIPNIKWIEILENSPYLKDIGLWVLKKALDDITHINVMLNKNYKVSVNVDIREITSRYYLEFLSALSAQRREILILELLERKLVRAWEDLDRVRKELRKLSIKLSFDDFGTGNTTLKYLTRVLPDEIKIDKSFITNIHTSKTQIITKAIIAMAKSLNIKTVAEGVEKKEELEVLKRLGCDIIQGYYFAKPMKLDDLILFLKERE